MGTNSPAIDVLAPETLQQRLGPKHCVFLRQLLLQERFSHGNNFEKLGLPKGSLVVYSLRLNHKERVLLTKHEMGGQYYWVVLDYLEHHEYDKSPFLKPGYLKQYLSLEKNRASLISIGKQDSATAANTTSQATVISTSLTAAPPTTAAAPAVEIESTLHKELHSFNNELIVLNADQEKALALSEPMLLTGMPGSGKSAVAVTYLSQYLNPTLEATAAAPAPLPLLYVAESELLVKQMKISFGSSPLGQTAMAQQLLFLSYDALLLREYPALKGLKRMSKTDFYTWFNGIQRPELTALKNTLGSKTAELVYQELRMMSGMSIKEYEATGGRASPLWGVEDASTVNKKGAMAGSATAMSDAEQQTKLREAIYKLKEEYCRHLAANKCYDSSFFALPPQNKTPYCHIAVDEAQDFSTLQLKTLHALALPAKNGPAIAYFADSHQSVEDNFPKHHFFKTILKIAHLGELPLTYRCSKEVLTFANNFLGMQYHVTGGQMDKGGLAFISTSEQMASGSTCCLPEKATHQSAAIQSHLVALTNTPQCAVITAQELIKETQARFPGAIVLTPKQAKGLEYDDIILYRLFEHPYYKQMNQLLADFEGCDVSAAVHRAKAGAANYEYTALFNGAFTAITRARKRLYLLLPQDRKELHAIEYVVSALRLGLPKNAPVPQATAVPVAKKEDWVAQIRLQLEHGNRPVALNLAWQHLGMNETQFDQYFSTDQKEKQNIEERHESVRDRKEDLDSGKDEKTQKTAPQKITTANRNHPTAARQKPKATERNARRKVYTKKAVTSAAPRDEITLQMLDLMLTPYAQALAPIHALLQQDNFFEQLFHIDTGNNLCLFSRIGHEKQTLLYNTLNTLTKKEPAAFAKKVTVESLCRDATKSRNGSPLFFLTLSKLGIYFLGILLNICSKEWIANGSFPLFLQTLYLPTKNGIEFQNYNALHSLCDKGYGQLVLKPLISNNLKLFATKEFVEAFCRFRPISAGEFAHTSALTWFCTISNIELLNELITFNPHVFATKEFVAALCFIPTDGCWENMSPLFLLCGHKVGREVLNKLMATNLSVFATEAFRDALCRVPAKDSTSALFLLCLDLTRIQDPSLTDKCIAADPILFSTPQVADCLCLTIPATAKILSNYSALFLLCSSPKGQILLDKLMDINPHLCTSNAFITTLKLAFYGVDKQYESALSALQMSKEGLALLEKMMTQNPKLRAEIYPTGKDAVLLGNSTAASESGFFSAVPPQATATATESRLMFCSIQ